MFYSNITDEKLKLIFKYLCQHVALEKWQSQDLNKNMPHCKDFTFRWNTVLLFSECFLLLPFDSKAVYWSSIMYKMWQSGLTFVSVLHDTSRHLIQPKSLFEVKVLLWPFFLFFLLLVIKQKFKLYFLWFFFSFHYTSNFF